MDRCTVSGTRCGVTIIFILLTLEVVGCHQIRLCKETAKCTEDEKIRLDRFVNGSRLIRQLDQSRLECNRKVVCKRQDLGCEYMEHTGVLLEYSCIKDLPLYDKEYPMKTGTLLSANYPNPIRNNEFRARLEFDKNVTLKLTFHDIGYHERRRYLTVYSFQGKNWTKYSRLVGVGSQKTFANAKIFDISLNAQRVWITLTIKIKEKPPVTMRQCPDSDNKFATNCPPPQKAEKPIPPKSKSWLIYTVVISVLSTVILVIIILYVWKRTSSIECTSVIRKKKCQEQRPDILTHFPSDGNIMTGDILAQEMEDAAAAEEAGNQNNGDEDQYSIYETISVPHYADFPQRPRPSLPDLPPLQRRDLASYLEVIPSR